MHAFIFYGAPPAATPQGADVHLFRVGDNLRTGEKDFERSLGPPTSLERDLLVVASAVLATDIAAKRGERESITRDLHLDIPVVNFHALEAQRVALERMLHFLSHDNWSITYRVEAGLQEQHEARREAQGKTLLFSGGLDSFSAAVDLLDAHGTAGVLLASHVTGNPTTQGSQKHLHSYLEERYGGSVERIVIRSGGKKTDEVEFSEDPEITQRTRSFMFLTIAALAARRRGMSEIVMIAENGPLAIHLPLSAGRIGAFSTHTAHPEVVARATEFFSAVLQYPITVENPFLYKTKAEVVAKLAAEHQSAIPLSMSCWKGARVGKHCGFCVPCYIRRVALESHGLKVDDWKRNMFETNVGTLPAEDDGKRNLSDLAEFVYNFRTLSDAELDIPYCELNNPYFDRAQSADMYRRFVQETFTVMGRYPALGHLL